jgi:hypothetical protein
LARFVLQVDFVFFSFFSSFYFSSSSYFSSITPLLNVVASKKPAKFLSTLKETRWAFFFSFSSSYASSHPYYKIETHQACHNPSLRLVTKAKAYEGAGQV